MHEFLTPIYDADQIVIEFCLIHEMKDDPEMAHISEDELMFNIIKGIGEGRYTLDEAVKVCKTFTEDTQTAGDTRWYA